MKIQLILSVFLGALISFSAMYACGDDQSSKTQYTGNRNIHFATIYVPQPAIRTQATKVVKNQQDGMLPQSSLYYP